MTNLVTRRLRRAPDKLRRAIYPPLRSPVSREFGLDRGIPLDRVYIDDFLARHGAMGGYSGGDIEGDVVEVGEDRYTRAFGGERVRNADVLHVSADNLDATIVGDLETGDGVPAARFDCFICTQTLNVVFDVQRAVRTLYESLRPGGVLLLTVAGICQAARPDRDLWGDYWRFTIPSVRRLLEAQFDAADISVEAYGNLATAVAFLEGRAAWEVPAELLKVHDPDYEILIAARAQKQR